MSMCVVQRETPALQPLPCQAGEDDSLYMECHHCNVVTVSRTIWEGIIVLAVIDHPRSSVVYNFGRVCLSVCLSDDNFRKPLCKKFILAHPVYLQEIRVRFVYEGYQVKVKVTGAKQVENS